MRTRMLLCVATATLMSGMFHWGPANLGAEGAAALAGVVTSQEEAKMEGVAVTARRDGATFTVSVVSDAQGRYSFPRTHVEPGKYALTIRAIGFDLGGPSTVDVTASKAASLDLKLQKAKVWFARTSIVRPAG